jgi:hypothetical protein
VSEYEREIVVGACVIVAAYGALAAITYLLLCNC